MLRVWLGAPAYNDYVKKERKRECEFGGYNSKTSHLATSVGLDISALYSPGRTSQLF